jgi:predicted nucleic acid-binding protein
VNPVLLDTGVIVALFDSTDKHHRLCDEITAQITQPFVTCEAVLMEACYLLRKYPAAVDSILENVERGIFQVPFQLNRSSGAVRAIRSKYADLPASLADACLVQLADESDSGRILTLDKHFLQYRWRRNKPFELLIAAN